MYTIKGFANIGALVDNTASIVAPLGELAPIGMTYAREKTFFTHAQKPATSLTVFSAKDANGYRQPDSTYTNPIIEMVDWIYMTGNTGAFNSAVTSFESAFISQFGGMFALKRTGKMIRYGSAWCPESVEVEYLTSGEDNTVMIWFSNDAFLAQYDEYEVEIVPPFEALDAFFDTYVNVKAKIDLIKTPETMERIELKANRYPYTRVRIDVFDWVNPVNKDVTIPTEWSVILYGTAADNLDAVREIIVEYILANSTHTREEWAELFPDLFTSTEYVITPFWNSYAIPNRVLESGMYSPTINTKDAATLTKKTVQGPRYTSAWIDENLEITATTYKSVAVGVVASPDNRDKIFSLAEKFEDYILISSVHPDFRRMTARTRDFVLMLTELLKIAESTTPFSTVPIGFNRIRRNGVYYIVRNYERVQYLVVTKYSLEDPAVIS